MQEHREKPSFGTEHLFFKTIFKTLVHFSVKEKIYFDYLKDKIKKLQTFRMIVFVRQNLI
jgi:hypothetical protein